jgi:hypothetical protein
MQRKASDRLLLAYYDATLLFLAFDALFGVNVRLAFLEAKPEWRAGYYVFCIVCAVVMHLVPAWRLIIGALEGMVTMLGLILGMYSGYVFVGVTGLGEFLQVLANYAISGYFAHLAWSRGMESLSTRLKTL